MKIEKFVEKSGIFFNHNYIFMCQGIISHLSAVTRSSCGEIPQMFIINGLWEGGLNAFSSVGGDKDFSYGVLEWDSVAKVFISLQDQIFGLKGEGFHGESKKSDYSGCRAWDKIFARYEGDAQGNAADC